MSKGLTIALIISLALNFIFVGAALTMFGYRFFGMPHRGFVFVGGPDRDVMFHHGGIGPAPHVIMGALDEETRKKVGEIIDADRETLRASFEAAKNARQDTLKALKAEPYSAEALEAAFAKSREADVKALEEGHKLAVKIISSLSPEERAKVAKAISEGRPKVFHKRIGYGWHRRGFGPEGKLQDFAIPLPPPGEEELRLEEELLPEGAPPL